MLDALAEIDESTPAPFQEVLAVALKGRTPNAHIVTVGTDPERLRVPHRFRSAHGGVTTIVPDVVDEVFVDDPRAAAADSVGEEA